MFESFLIFVAFPRGESDGSVRRHQNIRARRRKRELFGGRSRAWDRAASDQRRILRDHEPGTIAISAVRPAARRQPSKVAVFVDFLTELLAEEGD
jgi:hypothetical protein